MTEVWKYCAPCLFGIEGILADELRRLGAEAVQPGKWAGAVFRWTGDACARQYFFPLRRADSASAGRFRARSFDELFEGVRALPLERFIGRRDAFPVKGWSLNSQLHSVPDCQSSSKKRRWSVCALPMVRHF